MGGERHIRRLPLITFSRPGDRKRKGDRRVGVSDQEFKHVFHSARGTARFPRNSIFHAMRRYARRHRSGRNASERRFCFDRGATDGLNPPAYVFWRAHARDA